MTAEEIVLLTENTTLLNQETVLKLESLVEEYPYFQTARLLYVLNLKKIKNLKYASELRKLAFYSGDRRKLFYMAEADKFSPLNIEELEKPEEESISLDAFSLIDSFLLEKNEMPIPHTTNNTLEKRTLVSNDYISILLSGPSDNDKWDHSPMPHQDVIDRFLKEDEKSPVKIKLEKQDPEESISLYPVPDIVDEGAFFSETLAKIYLRQKKYSKALEIIRKLNLLYPEKNIYFADQIRFLEKLITNIKKT